MLDTPHHEHRIETYLDKLGYKVTDIQGYEKLQEGMSGASTYRIRFSDSEALLKIASAAQGAVALNRARRELAFYRDLAGDIPLLVPRVFAMYEAEDSVALLMAIYRSSPPPALWLMDEFLEAARQLGRFHAAFWDRTESLSRHLWLGWYQKVNFAADIKLAYIHWQTLKAQPHFANILTEQVDAWLQHLLTRIEAVPNILQLLPLTLCHGDCITANVLRDAEGRFVWADWQEVRLARGPEDLAFFLQRASIAGAAIQRDAIISAYHQSLEASSGLAIPLSIIYKVMDAAELWSRLLYWPAYLVQASESSLEAMLQSIRALAERLDIAP